MSRRKVSVIISNRNDVAMLVVTIRSCIEELRPFGPEGGDVVVADNSDAPIYDLVKSALPSGYCRDGRLKIYRQEFPCLFTAREMAASKAEGEYIMCLDSHMIVGRDCILDLASFLDRKADDPTVGFAHAPISWAHHHESRARHDRDISQNELGPWGVKYDHERTITWKGMPWMCRRDWFLNNLKGYGALSQHRVSWGGGDMHIGVKPWLLGYKNWAVPSNPCIHIGPFPKLDTDPKDPHSTKVTKDALAKDRYRRYSASGEFPHTFGFLVSCYVLGGDAMIQRNLPTLINRFGRYLDFEKWVEKAKEIGKDEKAWLDANKVMSFEEFIERKPWDD